MDIPKRIVKKILSGEMRQKHMLYMINQIINNEFIYIHN